MLMVIIVYLYTDINQLDPTTVVLQISLVHRCQTGRWYRWRAGILVRRPNWILQDGLWHHLLLFYNSHSTRYHPGRAQNLALFTQKRRRSPVHFGPISGLVIDAFGELRDQLDAVKDNCCICGMGKDFFDTVRIREYTSQETYVWQLYQERNWDFFQAGDCLRKQHTGEIEGWWWL